MLLTTVQHNGFSLFELLIVLLIISILGLYAVPGVSGSWDQLTVRRHAEYLLTQVSVLRHTAILHERGTVLVVDQNGWCGRYEDEPENECTLSTGQFPARVSVKPAGATTQVFNFSSGRGFSPLGAGRISLQSDSAQYDAELVVSTLGRVRLCTNTRTMKLLPCE